MNKQEAIQAIKSNYPPSNYTMLREALDLAIQALEKQVPKRAEFAGGRYICRCGWDIYREEQCYCWSCGQKLDWSDK